MAGSHIESWAMLAFGAEFFQYGFVIKILEERGDARSRYGQIAIGVLVMQDLIAVIFLAATTGHRPLCGLGAVFYWCLRKLIIPVLERLGHGEMVVLFAVFLAMDPGYILFESVGLKATLARWQWGCYLLRTRNHTSCRARFLR